ncbi:FmdB family zinc ribbon protein [Rugosimonospora africana]|uniref:Putative regulatory protein FmdB zinc ribbon domain-containing protein n=1 Tax=Rugosimonospora africana TaxID=556532 RepID=A0A8J3VRV8_9ACTN|nr:zinc ribbon domain-containing protein [Rugosimonospora africana]GIH15881.1 hypothetical protein Raf01_40530 [Rugosimonospora africana]
MATYEYRCPTDGAFEVRTPIGEAAPSVRCGACDGPAARVFSAPLLAVTPPALTAAIDRAGRSAESPEVVSQIPSRRPAHRR